MNTRGSSPQMRQINLTNPITPKPSRIPHQTFTPKPIYKESLIRQPPAGSKPVRNSIQLVMTGPPQPPSLHPPQKFMTTLPQQLSAPHYNHKVFRMTNKNMMHPFFSNPYSYHKQTIQNRVVDKGRVQDLYNRRKNKNPIQPLKNFKEQFQRNSKVQPSNNSAYGQFYSGEYKYGFFVNPQNQQNLQENGLNMQTITLDTMYPTGYFEKNQPNIQATYQSSNLSKNGGPTYEQLIRAKARTYLNSRRSSHSPMGFQETTNNFDATARNTIGSRGFWRAKREHDNHSHLTTHFRHPKHIKYNSIGNDFQTIGHSKNQRMKSYYPQGGVKDEIDSAGYRTNGWESPVGKRRGYSNMTKFKRDLELNKIQNSWRMSTYRNDVKGF